MKNRGNYGEFIYKGFIFFSFTTHCGSFNAPSLISNYNNHLLAFNSFLSGFMLITGVILIILGSLFVIYINKSFLKIGNGTPAPWDPPKKLVVTDLYRYVRNPMISGVLMILLGETLIFASIELLLWFATFFIINHIYIVYLEEPRLIKRFGDKYINYMKNFPRWAPYLKSD
ncbi:MAG: isoprenylcysteine carboxylmethyltransferase family protein [Methanobacteriaceae archaeon]|nr:isoprenylcysteine carboxylmethyltransferase family protein [Methanobacteriaceae archaeon]